MNNATSDENPQLLWADGLDDIAVTSEQFTGSVDGGKAYCVPDTHTHTAYETVVSAPIEFVEAPRPLPPPPALPPRAPLDPSYGVNSPNQHQQHQQPSLLRKATSFATDAASLVTSQVHRTLTKVSNHQQTTTHSKTLEAQAFNREILFRLPDSFVHRNLGTSQKSRINMITVEQYKPSTIKDIAAKLLPPATPMLYNTPPTDDPAGTLFFVNVNQVSCLVHKIQPPSVFLQHQHPAPSDPATVTTTLVVLKKDIPSPINTLLRIPSAIESFDSLAARLPSSFVVLPLVTDVERRARNNGAASSPQNSGNQFKSRIAINSECVISVSPFDLEWTNVVVFGSVRRSAVGGGETATSTSASASTHPGNEGQHQESSSLTPSPSAVGGVTAALQGVAKHGWETAKTKINNVKQGNHGGIVATRESQGTFTFQVALDFVSVLKALDGDGF
ncbi:UNVERIFIED_CONTAM: hypothetical protein HDU68_001337 [Siphonaria sp. JEL0065]|nr:hypothetical protein HDU68_001337 [Siphonaria sp. JEL0065]